jgi:flagellar basal-body rod protein FlgG
MRALNIAATGLSAQQTNVEVISQNLSNMTTTAYKMQRAEFDDLIYQNLRRTGTTTTGQNTILPSGVQIGLGVNTASISRNTGQGSLNNTENPLDLAIQGKGYFQIQLPDGTQAFTRDGTFKLSPTGIIVTREGFTVDPAITVPEDAESVSINAEGIVEVTLQGQPQPQQLGQIELASFINANGLQAVGNNLFLETPASGNPVLGIPGENSIGSLLQGYLENSNVNPVQEITGLIVAQRAYEMNTRVLSAADEMLQALNQSA